jgi:toxin ParE1/3/4
MSSRSLPIVLSARARADYDSITLYGVSNFGEEAARRYRDDLVRGIEYLSGHPELGRRRDELRPGLRSLVVKQHIVFYRIGESEITIVRIAHGRMDLTRAELEE